jgi:hypothetical protein
MKNIIVLLSICLLLTSTLQAQTDIEKEKDAIKKVIVDSYVDGVFNKGDVAAIKKGWHYDCDIVMIPKENVLGSIDKVPAYFLVEHFEKHPGPHKPGTTYEFTYANVVGYAGLAIIEIFQEGEHIYTDFFNLYKIDEEWKIVTKIFYRYPKD